MNGLGRTFLIYGASRGLGKAIVNLVPEAQDKVYCVSRTDPKNNAQLNLCRFIYSWRCSREGKSSSQRWENRYSNL